MTHHFNEPLWQQVRKERMRRRGVDQAGCEMSEWRTIDSAPKDGTAFLAVGFIETDDPMQQVVFYYQDKPEDDWVWATHDGPSYHISAFTHWMPLPQPPQG